MTAPDYPDFACFVEREIGYLQQKQDYSFPYFVKRGLYAEQVEAYLRYFPLQQMLFLDNEALKQKKVVILQKIETFLDLPTHNWGQTALVDQHVRSYQTQDMDTLKQLKRFYGPYNQKLYQQIGQVFNW